MVVQNSHLRSKYIETSFEEKIDMKNQFRFKNLRVCISIREAASQTYVDKKFNDSSIIKNTAHIDFND